MLGVKKLRGKGVLKGKKAKRLTDKRAKTRMNTTQTIDKALECLDKKAWQAPIDQLIAHFDGLSYDEELDDIRIELADILWQLVDTYEKDPEAPIDRFFAIRVSRLKCWSYHGHNRDETSGLLDYWNPLKQSYQEFASSPSKTTIVRSGMSFLADDMIKRWILENCA